MLVLTRRLGETIVIGNDIRITVVNVGPGRVKLGIQAPENVRIDREEIHVRIVEEQDQATTDTQKIPQVDIAKAAAASKSEEPLLVGDDTPRIHNRIADKLPADAGIPKAMNSLERFRRKPR